MQLSPPVFFILMYGFKLLSSVLVFTSRKLLSAFLQGRSTNNKFLGLLFTLILFLIEVQLTYSSVLEIGLQQSASVVCLHICVYIYMYILFQIIFHCGLFENIEYSSICYKLLKFLIEFEILLIRFGIQWIILLLLSSSLGMPPYSFLASIVFAKKLTHNVVNNLFVVSSLSF